MSNPARQLHAIYEEWRGLLSTPNPLSRVVDPREPEGAKRLMTVARLLSRIDSLLDEMEAEGRKVAVFRRQFPGWTLGMIGFSGGWKSAISADHVIPVDHLDQIEGFANYLDGKVPDMDFANLGALRDVVARARVALNADHSLSDRLRVYIRRLLDEIDRALDDDLIGESFDFAGAAERLYVATELAASRDAQGAESWRSVWTGTIANVIGGTIIWVAGAVQSLGG